MAWHLDHHCVTQSLALWDIKQGQELRGVLGTLLLHSILLPRHSEELTNSKAIRPETEATGHPGKVV